jgi:hypothetical protein
LRKLEGIARALAREVRPRKRALDDPGVRWALAQAGVNFAKSMFAEEKLAPQGHRGSRGKARELIDREEAGQARSFVLEAAKAIRCLGGRRRGRPAEAATTEAVRRLDLLYWLTTAKRPTRGGRKSPSRFELFLEAAIGDLVGAKARALGKRWQRAEAGRRAAVKAAELDGQNIAGEPAPDSEKA